MFSVKPLIQSSVCFVHKLVLNNIRFGSTMSAKVAVVLSGCGVYDGSEIHESTSILIHLSRGGAHVSMFAPDKNHFHIVDHTTMKPTSSSTRNVLVESARIARGNIDALSKLQAQNFDAVIFPGGFGAAKNLSSFATDGLNMKVGPDVERLLKEFHSAKKPIGLCCIAPVLAAKVISGCEVTIGLDKGTADVIKAMNSVHVKKMVSECHVDERNLLVTTPAYMCDAALHEIFDGLGLMVSQVLKLIKY